MSVVSPGRRDLAAARAQAGPRMNWRIHIGFAVACVALAVLYAGTFYSLAYNWAHDGTFQYAFLIPPIVAFLVWTRRSVLRRLSAAPRGVGVLALMALGVLWLAGALADINLVRQIAVLVMIPCLVLTFYGWDVLRALIFPMAYLYFALPIGDSLVVPLQHITANISVAFLKLTGVPVYLSNHSITTPASTWDVARACSGIKFFIATTAIGVLYANVFFRRWSRRIAFVVAAMVVPVIANGLRVYFTIIIGEVFGVKYASGTDHLIFGWQFFGLVLVLLFLVGWPWHETEPVGEVTPKRPGTASKVPSSGLGAGVLFGFVLLLLTVAPALMWLTTPPKAVVARSVELRLPSTLIGLPLSQPRDPAPVLGTVFKNANGRASARYGEAGDGVYVYAATYTGAPQQGHELNTFGNRLFDPDIWKVQGATVRTPSAQPRRELRLRSKDGSSHWLIWYWYRVNGHTTTSALRLKAFQAWERLRPGPQQAWVMMLATRYAPGAIDSARHDLRGAVAPLAGWVRDTGGEAG